MWGGREEEEEKITSIRVQSIMGEGEGGEERVRNVEIINFPSSYFSRAKSL